MLTELAEGLDVDDAAALSKDDLLAELGIPLSPVRLKCALLGLGTLRVALNRHSGTPLPDGLRGHGRGRLAVRPSPVEIRLLYSMACR